MPPSVNLPTRPIFWGRVAYPLAQPLEIVEAGGAYTPGALIKVTWKLILCSFMASIYGKIDGDIWSPYLFSRVHCCDKVGTGGPMLNEIGSASFGKYNITALEDILAYGVDPKTVDPVYGIPACEVPVMPRDDPLWSHSLYCDNNQYILDQTQKTKTAYSTLNILGTILFLPTGGHIGDVWGRKKVIFWTGFVSIGITMCYWLYAPRSVPARGIFWNFPPVHHGFVELCLLF